MKSFRLFLQFVGSLTTIGIFVLLALIFWGAAWMQVDDIPKKAECIVPLAGDLHRLFRAAELHEAGYAPVVMLSRSRRYPPSRLDKLEWELGHPRYAPYEFERIVLEYNGVPRTAIREFGDGHISTVEEAEALKKHLGRDDGTLLLVTSPYHARRAKMIFQDIFPEADILVSVPPEGTLKETWWRDQVSAQNMVLELAKTLHYLLGGVFRSTDAAVP